MSRKPLSRDERRQNQGALCTTGVEPESDEPAASVHICLYMELA